MNFMLTDGFNSQSLRIIRISELSPVAYSELSKFLLPIKIFGNGVFDVPPPNFFIVEVINDEKFSVWREIGKISKNTKWFLFIIAIRNIIGNAPLLRDACFHPSKVKFPE